MKIYLAGPITGCSYDGCTNWREAFKKMLTAAMAGPGWKPDDVTCLSPMRAKEYLNQVGIIQKDYPSVDFGPLSCARGIMTRDFFDCCRADLVVVNLLGAPIVSIGTVMEIAWAYQKRTPTIVVMEPVPAGEKNGPNVHEHPMIWEAIGFRVETLQQAADAAVAVLWPHV